MSPRPALDLRVSFAQGIRAPQVFDEDLHIASLGGEARVVRVDPDLRPERSVNWMAGGEWKPALWGGQALLEVNGFHTRLSDQFHQHAYSGEEHDDAQFSHLARLAFAFNGRTHGRLRELVDFINLPENWAYSKPPTAQRSREPFNVI